MKTFVIDTNVFVSAFLSYGGTPSKLVDALSEGRFQIVVNSQIIGEYLEVLSRPKFKFPKSQIDEFITIMNVQEEVELVYISDELPDDSDRIFIETALATDDKIIVTGNLKHYPKHLMKKLGVNVISPAEALSLI